MKATSDSGALRRSEAARLDLADAIPRQGSASSSAPSPPAKMGKLAELGELAAQRHEKRASTWLIAPRPASPMRRSEAENTVVTTALPTAGGGSSASGTRPLAGVPDGVPSANGKDAPKGVVPSSKAWNKVVAHIHYPSDDPRVSNLMVMLETLHRDSPTLRSRLDKIAQDGGVSIEASQRDDLHLALTNPVTREIHVSACVATDAPGSQFKSLPALVLEISNLSRADEFKKLYRRFHEGVIDVVHAARLKEILEFGSVSDMVSYFKEGHQTLKKMGFGEPAKWYARQGPLGAHDIRAFYPTVNEYLVAVMKTDHCAAYERQFTNVAAKMAASAASSSKLVENGQE